MASFFINRPIVAMVIAILTVLGGLIALRGLPLAQFPDIVPPQIIVDTTYTGADAVTIEQSVATPLEQQMNGVDNMLYMQSTNANDGTEELRVTFGVETNVSIDQVNVQNRVAQAQPNLPADVNAYGFTTRKSTGFPILGSCAPTLLIIPSAPKPGKMPHLTTRWRGQGHGLTSVFLPTRWQSDCHSGHRHGGKICGSRCLRH